jgi:glyoxylase-like metal-dependent hydrolase (beta-lactamase superfamily II)
LWLLDDGGKIGAPRTKMSIITDTNIYRFNVGDFECMAINDGTFTYEPPLISPPADFLFANAPKRLLKRTLNKHGIQADEWMAFVSPFTCVMVNTGRHKVLVDTGANGLTPNTGRLLHNLHTVGIEADDIDTVILTHAHDDHIGGNTDVEGKPAFPKARHIMWKEEWTFWTSEQPESIYENEDFTFTRKNLLSIQRQLELLDHEAEVVSGIRAVPAPGHTPGHMVVSISSNGEQLLCISDAFLHPIHIEHPEWHAAHEVAAEQIMKTRHFLLDRAATEKALMLAFHFPFPGLGYVIRRGIRWYWQPV